MSKDGVVLRYATTLVDKIYGDDAFINPLTNVSKVAVSYKSSNTDVATVSSLGKVTIKAPGVATITATYDGDAGHNATLASYRLTVKAGATPTLACVGHLQGKGDVEGVSSEENYVGTVGQSRRLEGMSLTLGNETGYEGGVRCMVHMRTLGWSQDWSADGAFSGTRGESRRVEAIRVELTGELAEHYDVWYRVHVQTYGWLGWTKNGEGAGTTAQSRRLEAYQVEVLPKGSEAPGATYNSFQGAL